MNFAQPTWLVVFDFDLVAVFLADVVLVDIVLVDVVPILWLLLSTWLVVSSMVLGVKDLPYIGVR